MIFLNYNVKITYNEIKITQLNKKSFVCHFEFDKYKKSIRHYFNKTHSPYEILSILEHKIKQETLMTFYEDERKDIIDFDKSCKINVNEKY